MRAHIDSCHAPGHKWQLRMTDLWPLAAWTGSCVSSALALCHHSASSFDRQCQRHMKRSHLFGPLYTPYE
eukprot:1136862-Pelagomonas_calceolata.AAC.1